MNKGTLVPLIAALLCPFSSAFAASGRSDNSGFVVWIFLGFCALIIVAQLVPAILVMLGMVKSAAEKSPEEAKQKTH
ncbi:hypothetical protein [Trichloromonas sp.]|uniref:hypothetical protein n=1 Tax=Trichloromonas sp. TaxID=3069249 RepID=UPI003D812EF7